MQNKPRIMIVDDDPDLGDLIETALEDNFETISVLGGREALEQAPEYEPDLFIVDIMMPIMSGWELIEFLRTDARWRSKPIVVLTAKDSREDMKKGYELGANIYLTKPVSIERLLKNLSLLEREETLKNSVKTLSIQEVRKIEARRRQGVPTPEPSVQILPAQKLPAKPEQPPVVKPPQKPAAKPSRVEPIFDQEQEESQDGVNDPFGSVDHVYDPSLGMDTPLEEAEEESDEAEYKELGDVPRILVADDDEEILNTIREMLGDRYELLLTRDGLEAMQKTNKYKPDIFIIDGMMPRMSGFQFCDAVHATEGFRNAWIIFMSARSTAKDRQYIKTLHVTRFLAKPFEPEELNKAIDGVVKDPLFRIRKDRPTWKSVLIAERDMIFRGRQKPRSGGKLNESRRKIKSMLHTKPEE
ncbi:MAG: response regulator [Candidatus Sumerlaeota bacterium]|nr:response regulator [Candidatus Sumerlaeota bacterium]